MLKGKLEALQMDVKALTLQFDSSFSIPELTTRDATDPSATKETTSQHHVSFQSSSHEELTSMQKQPTLLTRNYEEPDSDKALERILALLNSHLERHMQMRDSIDKSKRNLERKDLWCSESMLPSFNKGVDADGLYCLLEEFHQSNVDSKQCKLIEALKLQQQVIDVMRNNLVETSNALKRSEVVRKSQNKMIHSLQHSFILGLGSKEEDIGVPILNRTIATSEKENMAPAKKEPTISSSTSPNRLKISPLVPSSLVETRNNKKIKNENGIAREKPKAKSRRTIFS